MSLNNDKADTHHVIISDEDQSREIAICISLFPKHSILQPKDFHSLSSLQDVRSVIVLANDISTMSKALLLSESKKLDFRFFYFCELTDEAKQSKLFDSYVQYAIQLTKHKTLRAKANFLYNFSTSNIKKSNYGNIVNLDDFNNFHAYELLKLVNNKDFSLEFISSAPMTNETLVNEFAELLNFWNSEDCFLDKITAKLDIPQNPELFEHNPSLGLLDLISLLVKNLKKNVFLISRFFGTYLFMISRLDRDGKFLEDVSRMIRNSDQSSRFCTLTYFKTLISIFDNSAYKDFESSEVAPPTTKLDDIYFKLSKSYSKVLPNQNNKTRYSTAIKYLLELEESLKR